MDILASSSSACSCSTNSSYQFYNLPVPSMHTLNWCRLLCITVILVLNASWGYATKYGRKTKITFNRNHTGVYFDPVDFMEYNGIPPGLDETGLAKLINKISSRFSQLMISFNVSSRYGGNLDNDLFPEAVARHNQLLNLSLSSLSTSSSSFINLVILVKVANWDNKELLHSRMQQARILIDKANSAFPGTVKAVILEMDDSSSTQSLQRYNLFRNYFSKYETTSSYKIGIQAHIKCCAGVTSSPSSHSSINLKDILLDNHLEVAYFSEYMEGETSGVDVKAKVDVFTNHFGHCRELVDSLGRGIDVGFMTSWPGKAVDLQIGFTGLVQFWRVLNDWAEGSKTDVVLLQAFDTPMAPEPMMKTNGWWRLLPNKTYLHHSQFEFEEKQFLVDDHFQHGNVTLPSQPVKFATSGFGVAAFSLLSFVGLFLILVYLPRKLKHKLKKAYAAEILFGGHPKIFGRIEELNGNFNLTKYEIPKKYFSVDETSYLGSGTFGKVCRGMIFIPGREKEDVAVKMTRIPSPRTAIRGLLFDIKILAYLGKHPYIVELKGAYTAELGRRKAYVFLELCEMGSLETYLRTCKSARRGSSVEQEQVGEQEMGMERERSPFDTETENETELDSDVVSDMNRWSWEIASGMEFIASKHIVHLDLAARNILLTSDKRAKITDFGLSRRMYDYQTYVKKEQEPLPWRWMAPESLRRSEFTEKSDVWAFGVLLWEIYSLGDEPYPGLPYDFNFPTKLERGLRLGEPTYSPDGIYSVMLRCWATNPRRRPPFAELAKTLNLSNSTEADAVANECSSSQTADTNHAVENFIRRSSTQVQTISTKLNKFWFRVGNIWSSLAVIILLMIIVITLLAFRNQEDAESSWEVLDPTDTDHDHESFTTSTVNYPVIPLVDLDNNTTDDEWTSPPPTVPNPEKVLRPANETFVNNTFEISLVTEADPAIAIDHTEMVTTHIPPPSEAEVNEQPEESNVDYEYVQLPKPDEDKYRALLTHKLFIVIDREDDQSVMFLVHNGANVNARNNKSETPLHRAALCSNKSVAINIIKYLISNGADVEVKDKDGFTFLHRLVDEGTTLKPTHLHDLSTFLAFKNLTNLFNLPGPFFKRFDAPRWKEYYKRSTPFLMAVENVEIEMATLTLLKKHGVDFNAVNSDGDNVLFYAMMGRRSLRLISDLVQLGANWEHLNMHNQSLLHRVARFGHDPSILKFFLRLGLDVNGRDKWGYSPLHQTADFCSENVLEMIRILIENRADINIKNALGETPLDVVLKRKDLVDKDKIIGLLSKNKQLS